jgi:hypothetical protein
MKTIVRFLFFISCILYFANKSLASCTMIEIPLQKTIQHSNYIFTARILKKECFEKGAKIYTKNYFLAEQKLYGTIISDTLFLISEGGEINNKATVVYPHIELNLENRYLIFAKEIQAKEIILASGLQGCMRFLESDSVADFFTIYSFENQLIKEINFFKNTQIKIEPTNKRAGSSLVSQIISFSPTEITAGTNSILTINGNNFGNSKSNSRVLFRNANDGGVTFIEPLITDYISWSNTKIMVKVPSNAGTGIFKVETNSITSNSTPLNILWSRTNYIKDTKTFLPVLIDNSATGGYFFSIEGKLKTDTSFFNRTKEALLNWRCSTGVNFTLNNSTSLENESTISFAQNGELNEGVLGICYSNFSSCNGNDWYLQNMEIKILDTSLWNSSLNLPANNQFDYLSVITHELGHGTQLSHVISNSDLMNFSISKGQNRRILSEENINGTVTIIDKSIDGINCSQKVHKKINSENCDNVFFTYFSIDKSRIFPNPAKDKLFMEIFLENNYQLEWNIFDASGKLIERFFPSQEQAGIVNFTLDLDSKKYLPGIYFLQLKAGSNLIKKKFIVTN